MVFILFILFLLSLDVSQFLSVSSYQPFKGYIIIIFSVLVSLVGIMHIILLTVAVYRDSAAKKSGAKWIWSILTLLEGIPTALIYILFTHKTGNGNDTKSKRNNIILSVICAVLLVAFNFGAMMLFDYLSNYTPDHFGNDYITYKNSSGEEVIYDKMGNDYTIDEIENMTYYDRSGNSYNPIINYELFGEISVDGYICRQSGEQYLNDYEFYIDRDGYLCLFDCDKNELEYSSLGVMYDNEKNIYFFTGDCYWNADGELVFDDDYDKITYQDILNSLEKDKRLDLEDKIYYFFNFFEESDFELIKYRCSDEFTQRYIHEDNVYGLKSAKLIEKIDEGYIGDGEKKYFVTARAEVKPIKGSALYDPENKTVTVSLTITLEYIYNGAYDEWLVTEIKTET
ncbi:MAG: hypothetical protein ACI4IQ_00385 [Eubacterium sp.]